MPDNRSLCDRRPLPRKADIDSMDEAEFEAYMHEQTRAPACGACLLLAARIRRQACAILDYTEGKVHPKNPVDAWASLEPTRWGRTLDIPTFLERDDLDGIKYDAVHLSVDRPSVDDLVSEHREHDRVRREYHAAALAARENAEQGGD